MFSQSEISLLLSVRFFLHTSLQKYYFFPCSTPTSLCNAYILPMNRSLSQKALPVFTRKRANFRVYCILSSLLINVLTKATATFKMSSVILKKIESSFCFMFLFMLHLNAICKLFDTDGIGIDIGCFSKVCICRSWIFFPVKGAQKIVAFRKVALASQR